MNRNLVLFIALSVGIYAGWMWYLGKKYPEMGKRNTKSVAELEKEAMEKTKAASGENSVQSAAPALKAGAAKAQPKPVKEETVTIRTKGAEVMFSSLGAKVVSWKLLNYKETLMGADPVQLVPVGLPASNYGALSVEGAGLETALWTLETKSPTALAGGAQEVAFRTGLGGLVLRKVFRFEADDFVSSVSVQFENPTRQDLKLSQSWLLWGPGIGQSHHTRNEDMATGGAVQMEGKLERESLGDTKTFGFDAPKWVAVKNQYFVAALLNDSGAPKAELRRESHSKELKTVTGALGFGELTLKAGEKREFTQRLYAGPQLYSRLSAFGNNLEHVIQFSFQWLSSLSVLLLKVMQWFHALTGNWGFAIVLLTLAVKLALAWPTHKGMVTSRRTQMKMAKMQPVLESLKRTYKDNPSKLSEETMKLYKEHGVNPLSGCMMMLPQMFIMIALYGALNGAFELRQAGFVWIWTDLSAADPSYILVPLMGASMWLQQKMTPQSMATSEEQEQMQKMMLWMMPIMFTVMGFLFKWPTGLLIYWSVSNVFSISQQWYVNKTVTE
jgi:YidC/Oxa1 family membrane protein insertase